MFFKNSIDIEGRLTRKPEVKTSANGTVYCRFGIAHNQSRKNKETGEWTNIAHFFNCVTFKKMAEFCGTFEKGDPVTISGILQYSQYDKDGEKKHDISILVNDIKKLNIPKKTATATTSKSTEPKKAKKKAEPTPTPPTSDFPNAIEEYDPSQYGDEIPF